MKGYLVDTNVLSELRRPRRNPAVVAWFSSVASDDLFLSVLTLPICNRRAIVIILAVSMDLPTRLDTHFAHA